MNTSDKHLLLRKFRTAFSRIDYILQSTDSPLKPRKISELAELANVTLTLNAFLKRYEAVLDDTEREILKSRIDSGIDKLLKLNQSHILSLYYFKDNFRRNPTVAVHLVINFMISVRALFELAPVSRIPLDSTIWNYFVRDVSHFVYDVVKAMKTTRKGDEIRGRLSFLLLVVIHSLVAILRAPTDSAEARKKTTELRKKAEKSLWESTSCLFDLFKTSLLEPVFDTSPGFIIYLHRVLQEDLTRFDGNVLSELKSVVNERMQTLNVDRISERSKNFLILNAMELGQEPPKGIAPSGNDALACLADGFLRFEKGEKFLGILPVEEDVRALIRKLTSQVATKTDVEKIERLLVSQQVRFQEMLRKNMEEIKRNLQIKSKIGKEKTTRFWNILEKIATISDTVEFMKHLKDLFSFLHENKIMSIVLPLILRMLLG